MELIDERTPSPSPRSITTSDRFFPSKIPQFRSEYQLKDHLKESHPFESVMHIIDNSMQITPKHSLVKVLSDQTLDTSDRTVTSTRRYSSSDIDLQSIHAVEFHDRHSIEQQKKRRVYNFNHTLFSNIYKRAHRSSSIDSHLCQSTIQNRERQTRHRHQSFKESDMTDEPTTSDCAYSRALEKTTLIPATQSNGVYRAVLTVPDDTRVRTLTNLSSRQHLSDSETTADPIVENGHAYAEQQKSSKINVDGNSRTKRLPFLSTRRRTSYYPMDVSTILSDDQKRKRDVIWPLKRSYSFDTPFHRETIEALNKGT
jgi:hypothetical protein